MAPATTRRDLFGAAGFTALAGIAGVSLALPDGVKPAPTLALKSAGPALSPDAELIALCEQIMAMDEEISATYAVADHRNLVDPEEVSLDAVRMDLMDRQDDLVQQLHGLRATTIEGHQARARSYLRYCGGEVEKHGRPGGCVDDRMVWQLVRDLCTGVQA